MTPAAGEPIPLVEVYKVYSEHGASLVDCMTANSASKAYVSIDIDGPSGRVMSTKIDGKSDGALYTCLDGALRALQFPIATATTTVSFDISL